MLNNEQPTLGKKELTNTEEHNVGCQAIELVLHLHMGLIV